MHILAYVHKKWVFFVHVGGRTTNLELVNWERFHSPDPTLMHFISYNILMNLISKRFVGRANRRSFALPISFIVLFPYIFYLITVAIILDGSLGSLILGTPLAIIYIIFGVPWLFPLLFLINLLATPITVRRLHDIGRSAWLCPLIFIPFIDCLFTLILILKSGDKTENKYGKVPTYQKKPSHIFFWVLFFILLIATVIYAVAFT